MPMNFREFAFQTWAPPGATWSPWAKPVMFAHTPEPVDDEPLPTVDTGDSIVPPADGQTALVIDLPALRSIGFGLATAALGYRPVPLFNAIPSPVMRDGFGLPGAVVDLWPAAKFIVSSVNTLADLKLPNDAPPAFMLDADRRGSRNASVDEGDFDNRSISLTTDFPSAALLGGAGVRRVLLISASPAAAEDLAHTLRRWQQGGLKLSAWNSSQPAVGPHPLKVPRPRTYRLVFQRWLAAIGLRRSPFGGFGALLPIHYSGGGG